MCLKLHGSLLFSCPGRFYTISGTLRDNLPPKGLHMEMWDTLCCVNLSYIGQFAFLLTPCALPSPDQMLPVTWHHQLLTFVAAGPKFCCLFLHPCWISLCFEKIPTSSSPGTRNSLRGFPWSVMLRCFCCGYNIHIQVVCCARFSTLLFRITDAPSHTCYWLTALLFSLYSSNQVWKCKKKQQKLTKSVWHSKL